MPEVGSSQEFRRLLRSFVACEIDAVEVHQLVMCFAQEMVLQKGNCLHANTKRVIQ